MHRIIFEKKGECLVSNPPEEGKILLVSLLEASRSLCVTKESLTSLSRTLFSQTRPSLIIYSNHQDHFEAYDYYFYSPSDSILSPVTLVKGWVFENLTLQFEEDSNRTLFATAEKNPFQTFYEGGLFLGFRITWILMAILILFALSRTGYLIMSGEEKSHIHIKLATIFFCVLERVLHIIFLSLGGDFTSLFKRALYEISPFLISLGFCSFLFHWMIVLDYGFHEKSKLLLAGKVVSILAPLCLFVGFVVRICEFVARLSGVGFQWTYILTLSVPFLVGVIFQFGVFWYVRKLLKKARNFSAVQRSMFEHYNKLIFFLSFITLLCLITIGVSSAFNKRSMESFITRLWLYELGMASLSLFFSLALFPVKRMAGSSISTGLSTNELASAAR